MSGNGHRDDFKVISLSTIKPAGIPVEIDGQRYETVPLAWWGAEQARAVRKHMFTITNFDTAMQDPEKPEPSDNDTKAYKHALREFAKILIPDAPPTKIEELPDGMCQMLVSYFLSELRNLRSDPLTEGNTTKPIGQTSLVGSAELTQE